MNWGEALTVDGKSGWKKTAYQATEGEELTVVAKGRVMHSWASGWHGPEGNPNPFCRSCKITPRCHAGALIMKIGRDGKAYCVEGKISVQASGSGAVYFAINDHPLNDNEGEFTVILYGPGLEKSEKTPSSDDQEL